MRNFVKIIKADTEEKRKYLGAITSILISKEDMEGMGTALTCDRGDHPWQDDEIEQVDFKPAYSLKFSIYPNREMLVTANDEIHVATMKCPKLGTLDRFAKPMTDLIEDIIEDLGNSDEDTLGRKHYEEVRTAFEEYWADYQARHRDLLASQPAESSECCYILNGEGIHKMAYDSENEEIKTALQKGLCFPTYEDANKKRAELLENALRNL